jgi:hypothetical protein
MGIWEVCYEPVVCEARIVVTLRHDGVMYRGRFVVRIGADLS